MPDKKTRSLLKAISWRFLASLTTALLVYIYTQELTLSFSVGLADLVTKLFLYYFHERIWDKLTWGQIKAE